MLDCKISRRFGSGTTVGPDFFLILSYSLMSCISWWTTSQSNPDNLTTGIGMNNPNETPSRIQVFGHQKSHSDIIFFGNGDTPTRSQISRNASLPQLSLFSPRSCLKSPAAKKVSTPKKAVEFRKVIIRGYERTHGGSSGVPDTGFYSLGLDWDYSYLCQWLDCRGW